MGTRRVARTATRTLHPARRCLCDYEPELIERLAKQRYLEGIPTLSLLARAKDPLAKEAAALVGLLDLPEAELAASAPNAARRRHLLACRRRVLARLARAGLEVEIPD